MAKIKQKRPLKKKPKKVKKRDRGGKEVKRRKFHKNATAEVIKILHANTTQAYFSTIIPYRGYIPYDDLEGFCAEKFRLYCYRKIRLCLESDIMAFGSIDISLELQTDGSKYWSLHVHLLSDRDLHKPEKQTLLQSFKRDYSLGVKRPVRVQSVSSDEWEHAVGYTFKYYFTRRSHFVCEPQSRKKKKQTRNKKQRLSSAEAKRLDAYLNRYKVNGLMLLFGCKRKRTVKASKIRLQRIT